MDDFYAFWFGGFQSAVDKLGCEGKEILFTEFAAACSKSLTERLYRDAWMREGTFGGLFKALLGSFEQTDYIELIPEKSYDIIYKSCACPLYTDKLMTTGALCECSRLSLLHNLNALNSGKAFSVDLAESILRGGSSCRLRVIITEKTDD